MEPATGAWSRTEPTGTKPASRGGHSATLVGSRLFVFGGEDKSRKTLAELHCLDLASMAWSQPLAEGPAPSARTGHAAAACGSALYIFGGGSTVDCFADLKMLDTEAMVWTAIAPEGPRPKPRAGCSSAVLGGIWYICGGGDGSGPRRELLSLRLAPPSALPPHGGGALAWEVTPSDADKAKAAGATPLAREGLSVLAVPFAVGGGALLTFGGYDGKYHSDLHCLRQAGAVAPMLPAAQPAKAALPATIAAANGSSDAAATGASQASASIATPPSEPPRTPAKSAEAVAIDQGLLAAKEAAAAELALMRRQLASVQARLPALHQQPWPVGPHGTPWDPGPVLHCTAE